MTPFRPAALTTRGMMSDEYPRMAQAEDSHWWYTTMHGIVSSELKALDGHSPLVVDVGCGTGGTARALARANPAVRYIGLDIKETALAWASATTASLLAARADALPLSSNCADVLICLDVLYFEDIDIPTALRDFHRVLMPGGLLLVNLPAFEFLRGRHDRAVRIPRRFRRDELSRALLDAGFRIEKAFYWNVLLMLPLLVWRTLTRGSSESISDLDSTPRWANRPLAAYTQAEASIARAFGSPWGSSIFASARKPI